MTHKKSHLVVTSGWLLKPTTIWPRKPPALLSPVSSSDMVGLNVQLPSNL